VENLAPTGIRPPDRPARSQLLYRLLSEVRYNKFQHKLQPYRSADRLEPVAMYLPELQTSHHTHTYIQKWLHDGWLAAINLEGGFQGPSPP